MMIECEVWDEKCRDRLKALLEDDEAVIGLTFLLFGGYYTAGQSTIEKLIGLEHYQKRVHAVLDGAESGSLHESAVTAFKKAVGTIPA